MLNIINKKSGLTLVELIITMAVFGILYGVVTVNLMGIKRQASLNSSLTTLISDIKNQQLKAMSADTEGRSTNDSYGLYFASDRYILFHGVTYNPSETSNFSVSLGDGMEFSTINLPTNSIVFTKGSGEISNFLIGSNTLTLTNTQNNEVKTITINQLGTITTVN
ncbi:hypothetical protein A2Y99_02015 [Candidatus Gottesmanbacteria bacterium RBG_13_37_7]|uniref:General secretion pathway GspH domain-containing protein n=1 Tax=Candidatus Gottesmanbacteria bacterium RBG_13_37_7 TaxID=1798369 RepID=A0A1F5YHS3_9BACT|nr:MAG: hypothetical protein A2Y99_02015 [Candidatus Gottesmanbacteria bacterium RBG_13_37_7]